MLQVLAIFSIAAAEAAAIGMQMRDIRIRPERRGDDPWWDWL
jgi:hypothetical protein